MARPRAKQNTSIQLNVVDGNLEINVNPVDVYETAEVLGLILSNEMFPLIIQEMGMKLAKDQGKFNQIIKELQDFVATKGLGKNEPIVQPLGAIKHMITMYQQTNQIIDIEQDVE